MGHERLRFAFLAAALGAALAACPSPECSSAVDCDDTDPSTDDTCGDDGKCVHTPCADPCNPDCPVAGGLKIGVLDVGQGDSIAIVAPSGCAALIDAGPTGSGPTIRSYLHAQGVTRLDFALASHYHADHIGGLDEVEIAADGLPIKHVYDRGDDGASAVSGFSTYTGTFGSRRSTVAVGDTLTLCDEVCFQVLATNANGVTGGDENSRSVVVRLGYGPFSMLLGGDLTGYPANVEATLTDTAGIVDVYKVHHHGSSTSSTRGLLDAIQPSVSLVSVGWDNTFGHPSSDTISRLKNTGSAVWLTEDSTHPLGSIEVEVEDATRFKVTQGKASLEYPVKRK